MSRDRRDAKQQLRDGLAKSLAGITADVARASGLAVRSRLLEWEGFAEARSLVAFSSLPGEVATQPLMAAAYAAGKTLLLPRIFDGGLDFVPVEEGEPLVEGPFRVLEPTPTREARSVLDRAIVLVPGLAFDLAGGRLGRGAGYYDRALVKIRESSDQPIFIGVGFPFQIVERIPMSAHDVAMDAVLTQDGLIWADLRRSAGVTRENSGWRTGGDD